MPETHATITLDLRRSAGQIDRRIFGGFLEHMGRAVYEGVFDPGARRSDASGYRTDVAQALRDMRLPIVRYPGGNFVSNYDWRDGVGPRESRPVRTDFAWQSIEPNTFGTDEFIAWCRMVNAEPMLAVNLGTLGAREAAELVEYCNHPSGTYWSDRRATTGPREPYGVKLWCLGNEMDGPWQAGHVTADRYAEKALVAARLMKGIDRSIELVACGSSGRSMPTYMEWDRVVLEHCWDSVEYISAHRYSRNTRDDSRSFLAEGVVVDRIIDDYRALVGYVRAKRRADKRVYLSFDEWNVWYKAMEMRGGWTKAPALIEEVYNLEDALVCAQYLNAFIRNADFVKVACLAQLVNVIAPILTSPDGILLQSIYWPFQLLSQSVAGTALRPDVDGPTVDTRMHGHVPALDVAASVNRSEATVSIVNRSDEGEIVIDVTVPGHVFRQPDDAQILHHSDLKAHNTWRVPDTVVPAPIRPRLLKSGALRVRLPGPSHVVIRTKIGS